MNKVSCFICAVVALVSMQSCASGAYKLLTQEAKKSRIPGYEAFIVDEAGDTVKGSRLDIKRFLGKRPSRWLIDGKYVIPKGGVAAWQDKNEFRVWYVTNYPIDGAGLHIALIKSGKLNFYAYDMTYIRFGSSTVVTEYAYRKNGGPIKQIATMRDFRNAISDNAAALKKFDEVGLSVKSFSFMRDLKPMLDVVDVYNATP